MAEILGKYTTSNNLINIKLFLKQLKYPPDRKIREEVIITCAKISHSHLTHAYLIRACKFMP